MTGKESITLLPVPGVLTAYPHYYDFSHTIILRNDDTFEMIDGAGQACNFSAKGRFRFQLTDDNSGKMEFCDFVELDPYEPNIKIRDLETLDVDVEKQSGLFAFC